jgi:putative oxidoreductase
VRARWSWTTPDTPELLSPSPAISWPQRDPESPTGGAQLEENDMNPMDTSVVTTDREVNTIPAAMHHDPASARREIAAWDAFHREERQAVEQRHAYFYTAGRVLVGVLFILMALDKMLSFNDTVSAVAGTGYASAPLLVGFALSLELVAGVLLVLGWNARIAAGWLSIYLVTVTIMFNWDQGVAVNRAIALANLGFVAALLMVAAHGAGAASLDKALGRRREEQDRLAERTLERQRSVH